MAYIILFILTINIKWIMYNKLYINIMFIKFLIKFSVLFYSKIFYLIKLKLKLCITIF